MAKNINYYWLSWATGTITGGDNTFSNNVSTEHPFNLIKDFQKNAREIYAPSKVTLLNWKEISKEEYDLFLYKQ